jgi:hypothetical protein
MDWAGWGIDVAQAAQLAPSPSQPGQAALHAAYMITCRANSEKAAVSGIILIIIRLSDCLWAAAIEHKET